MQISNHLQKLSVNWFKSSLSNLYDEDSELTSVSVSMWMRTDGSLISEGGERTALSMVSPNSETIADTQLRVFIKRSLGTFRTTLHFSVQTDDGIKIIGVTGGGKELGRGMWHHICMSAQRSEDLMAR